MLSAITICSELTSKHICVHMYLLDKLLEVAIPLYMSILHSDNLEVFTDTLHQFTFLLTMRENVFKLSYHLWVLSNFFISGNLIVKNKL